jgi:Protein of unknown function (DUF3179)/CarboxypepD_reg-like domain
MTHRMFITALIILIASHYVNAQSSINGSLKDKETNEPIIGATVFIEHTTIATVSDKNGAYELKNIPSGFNKVIVSHVGYKSYSGKVSGNPVLNILLRPLVLELEEAEVSNKVDRQWKRLYSQFEKAFLGNSINAKQSKILNPWVIELTRDSNGKIKGHSTDFIQIENRGTGYTIRFLLDKVELENDQITYVGKPLFSELDAKNEPEKVRWKNNRLRTYLGSKQHFLYALSNNKLNALGYEINHVQFDEKKNLFTNQGQLSEDVVITNGLLQYNDFLGIVYTKEVPEVSFINDQTSSFSMAYDGPDKKMLPDGINFSNGPDAKTQVSYLFNRASKVALNELGQVKNPEYLLEYGYWSWERIAELMPFEYHLNYINQFDPNQEPTKVRISPTADQIQEKNGFKLTNLLIPVDEIISGGVRKDGIPAINNPKFTPAIETDWLHKKDMVLGVEYNGQARAYPIRILDRHEAVNDEINGKPILITFCPLCGSGMAFDPLINGEKSTFGISGLLFNSDVLLYDRETMSLWSQLETKAVSGAMSGNLLTHLPSYHMTWQEWKNKFPKSLVLTRETGFNLDYDSEAYSDYKRSNKLMFAVKDQNPNFATKEMVIGISINGKHKAYTLKKLKKLKRPLEDELGGNKLTITYSKLSDSAIITDQNGRVLPSTRLYWFAWYAFHVDTEIY